ncbi:hypothetical protein [Bacillus sp. TH007]|uniref:hypothetical protein n=1 Tax=Bacillus sp. TH007 TaxID=1664037 RepID=UPI00071D73D9|nr:hypothetical protein [Bacillus sp. TH007]KRV44035.1 hypothetical protein AS196_13910 [Bacillus sp. TH007]
MDIKSPLPFETSDKAHANLFNRMVNTLVENDNALSQQIAGITNESLFILTGDQAIQDASVSGEEYPIGITLMAIANDTGYPTKLGFVKNEKMNEYRFVQYYYGNGNETNSYFTSTGIWFRQWYIASGWTEWHKISGFLNTNIGTTGKQLLTKAEYQKVLFNRKIKDSHNNFDIKNNRFICPENGMYLVNAGVYIESFQRYTNFELSIYLNGKRYKNIAHHRQRPESPSDTGILNMGLYGAANVPANKGDYLEIYIYVNYEGDVSRYVSDKSGWFNYFDITELGGRNFPIV